jgi:hypothetical protein
MESGLSWQAKPGYRDVWAAVVFFAHLACVLYVSFGIGLPILLREETLPQ